MMENVIALDNQEMTMSSLEIVELTGKQHFNVRRDIEVMLKQLNLDAFTFEYIYLDSYKREQKAYKLPKNLCLNLIAGYSVVLRQRIIDRWLELESQEKPALPDFTNPVATARAWADEVEQKQEAQQQLLEAKPAIDFVDRYVDANGLQTLTNVAKMLGLGPHKFTRQLREEKVLYKCDRNNVPRQDLLNKQYFEVKTGEVGNGENSSAFVQTLVTAKGIQWLASS